VIAIGSYSQVPFIAVEIGVEPVLLSGLMALFDTVGNVM
jgi:hypothetical protein